MPVVCPCAWFLGKTWKRFLDFSLLTTYCGNHILMLQMQLWSLRGLYTFAFWWIRIVYCTCLLCALIFHSCLFFQTQSIVRGKRSSMDVFEAVMEDVWQAFHQYEIWIAKNNFNITEALMGQTNGTCVWIQVTLETMVAAAGKKESKLRRYRYWHWLCAVSLA